MFWANLMIYSYHSWEQTIMSSRDCREKDISFSLRTTENLNQKWFSLPHTSSSFYNCWNRFLKMVDDLPQTSQLGSCRAGSRTQVFWFLVQYSVFSSQSINNKITCHIPNSSLSIRVHQFTLSSTESISFQDPK